MHFAEIPFVVFLGWCSVQAGEGEFHFLLVAPENMDEKIVTRVEQWMTIQLHYPVKVQRLPAWDGNTADEQMAAVLKPKGEHEIAAVVLASTMEPADKHAVVDVKRMAGVVHVGALVPTIEEKTLRRLDRQAMRIVGFSLEIPAQPIPYCCLYSYKNLKELDQIGRAFSPPAQALYRKQLQKKGIPLSKSAKEKLPDVHMKFPAPPPAGNPPE